MSQIPPLCQVCSHFHNSGNLSCDAYPEGIPVQILAGERHIDIVPDDHGVAFRKKFPGDTLFLAETKPETLFRVTCAGSYERYTPILDIWELDNEFIRYVLAMQLKSREITREEGEAFMEKTRECLDSMNPCMREIRQKMYLTQRKNDLP